MRHGDWKNGKSSSLAREASDRHEFVQPLIERNLRRFLIRLTRQTHTKRFTTAIKVFIVGLPLGDSAIEALALYPSVHCHGGHSTVRFSEAAQRK